MYVDKVRKCRDKELVEFEGVEAAVGWFCI
jgi:hypothetical protein